MKQETHPEYADYLYVVAPVSLCALTPIGIIMMTIQKKREEEKGGGGGGEEGEAKGSSGSTLLTTLWSVFKGVFGNPLVFMTMVGLLGNVIFTALGFMPDFLAAILQMLR